MRTSKESIAKLEAEIAMKEAQRKQLLREQRRELAGTERTRNQALGQWLRDNHPELATSAGIQLSSLKRFQKLFCEGDNWPPSPPEALPH